MRGVSPMLAPLLLASTLAAAGEPTVYSGLDSQLQVAPPRIDEPQEVDGALNEPAWQRAALLTGFSLYSPVDGRPAEERTEVRVFYSAAAIHFGITAWAPPGTVRASLANRDQLAAEDSVTLFLSTYNDGRQAFVFSVNPLGVQSDGTLVEGTAAKSREFGGLSGEREPPDLNPDFVFQSKGRLTESGYEVEVRIPFKSLRYQKAAVQSWGLHVVRKVQATGYEHSWAPAKRSAASFLAQGGTLTGLSDLRPGLVLDLTPVVTAHVDGAPAPGGWSYDADRPELGGNVRWGVTPNLALNGTVNPDFSQVEADASQLVYDPREALFYPEKRPFFLDGLEQFSSPNRLIYTRRIVAPLGAVKLTGKASGTNLGLLSAVDDPLASHSGDRYPVFNILRAQRDIGGQSKLGFVYTDRIDGDDSNRVGGLDTHLTFGGIHTLDLQGAWSRTQRAGTTTTAPLFQGIFSRNGRRLGTRALLRGIHEDFRAESGFISRPGLVVANLDQRASFFGKQGAFLEAWSTDVVLDGNWKYAAFFGDGGMQDRKLHINNNATLRGGWKAGASILIESFGYDPDLYADYALRGDLPGEVLPFTGTPRLPNLDYVLSLDTPAYQRFSGRLSLLWGKDENFFEWSSADILYATLAGTWRPTTQLRIEGQYQLQQFERRSDGSLVGRRQIPRLKLEYQLSRFVFLRAVAEYDAEVRDALRDDSRTERPILIRDEDGVYRSALRKTSNRLRVDFLFSWQPTPGTVFFAGYGSTLEEPDAPQFHGLSRQSDGFFVKLSYLFRL
jgi:hypothetical protein